MSILKVVYKITHPKTADKDIPYYWQYSLVTVIKKPIRKFFSAVIIPTIPFNNIRVIGYRLCGYRIGGGYL